VNVYFQATSIGQYHDGFRSPYADQFSLQAHPEAEASITTTLFFGLRLARNTQFYFDPEVAAGRGFSGTNGMANSPNGETPCVIVTPPKPYIARLYVTQDFGFGDSMENFNSEENQFGGSRPINRYSISIGRFTVTDFFDNNRYSHDPRTQFMGWAIMNGGHRNYGLVLCSACVATKRRSWGERVKARLRDGAYVMRALAAKEGYAPPGKRVVSPNIVFYKGVTWKLWTVTAGS
jgi:hypothetical protein